MRAQTSTFPQIGPVTGKRSRELIRGQIERSRAFVQFGPDQSFLPRDLVQLRADGGCAFLALKVACCFRKLQIDFRKRKLDRGLVESTQGVCQRRRLLPSGRTRRHRFFRQPCAGKPGNFLRRLL